MNMVAGMKQIERQVVDIHTGEVLEHQLETVTRLEQEPPYVKLYIHDLGNIVGLKPSEKDVLLALAMSISMDGYITLSARRRKLIGEQYSLTAGTVNNAISSLVKQGLLASVSRGEYQLSPHYFARGKWYEILKQRRAFELRIRYSSNGRVAVGTEEAAEQLDLLNPATSR